jgi:hypothetical protein
MGRITTDNYEEYLLDRAENKLDTEALRELEFFLSLHPELDPGGEILPVIHKDDSDAGVKLNLIRSNSDAEDLEILSFLEGDIGEGQGRRVIEKMQADENFAAKVQEFRRVFLKRESGLFSGKPGILKDLEAYAFEFFEGNLPRAIAEELKINSASHKVFFEHVEEWSKTKLLADHSFIFDGKEKLMKRAALIKLFGNGRAALQAAAAILLLLMAVITLFFSNEGHEVRRPVEITAKGDPRRKIDAPANTPTVQPVKKEKQKTIHPRTPPIFKESEPLIANTEAADLSAPKNASLSLELSQVAPGDDSTDLLKIPAEIVRDTSIMNISNSLAELPVLEDEEDVTPVPAPKSGFWKSAVNVFRNLHKIGMKNFDGEEVATNDYKLSLNELTIEKK